MRIVQYITNKNVTGKKPAHPCLCILLLVIIFQWRSRKPVDFWQDKMHDLSTWIPFYVLIIPCLVRFSGSVFRLCLSLPNDYDSDGWFCHYRQIILIFVLSDVSQSPWHNQTDNGKRTMVHNGVRNNHITRYVLRKSLLQSRGALKSRADLFKPLSHSHPISQCRIH
jgi:hypothetical protein